MKKRYILILISIIAFLAACETDITVDLPVPQEKLVVEGFIESDKAPFVFLTRNSGYFDAIDSTSIFKTLVMDSTALPLLQFIGLTPAEIDLLNFADDLTLTITDQQTNLTDTLYPSFYPKFPYIGYTSDQFAGVNGNSYRLDIYYNAQHFYGLTTIPEPIEIDSIWFNSMPDLLDTAGYFGIRFIDPPEYGNYYALHNLVEGEHLVFLKPFFGSNIADDSYDNGDTIIWGGISKGYDSNDFTETEIEEPEDYRYQSLFFTNSTVQVRLSTIDAESYIFWNSFSRHLATDGNPFTNPATIMTNLQGGNVLGIWEGYGTSIERVFITDSATLNILSK
jgi:hypothetical protein